MSSSSPPQYPSNALNTKPSSSPNNITTHTNIPVKPQHPLDAKLERITKEVLPSAPYLLRLKDRAAQYRPRDHSYWRKGTHFEEDEEELQYLTFRQRHDDSILLAHGQWDDEYGGIASREVLSSQNSSGRTPSIGQIPKKKITLEDYKKLDKSKPRTSDLNNVVKKESAQTKPQDVLEAAKKEDDEMEGQKQGEAASRMKAVETQASAVEPSRKRSADDMTGAKDVNIIDHGPLPPPAKKLRPSMDPAKAETEHAAKANLVEPSTSAVPIPKDKDKSAPKTVKAFSSKDDIPTATTSSSPKSNIALRHGLPPMLSPTLPPDIEEALAKITPNLRGGFSSSRVSSASPSMQIKSHKDAIPSSGSKKPSISAIAPPIPKQLPREPKQITSAPRQSSQGNYSKAQPSLSARKSKIVKIKIRNKVNRRTLMQYLRMKPTPNRGSRKVGEPARHDDSSDTDEPLAKRNPGKGKRRASVVEDEDYEQQDAKRGKISGQLQRNGTSKPSAKPPTSSSGPSLPGSAQKSHLSAPLNNVMSSDMTRTGSQESVATPARDVTPTTNGHKVESPTHRDWLRGFRLETARLLKLATNIKHDSDVFLKLKGNEYEKSRKLGSVIATEAVLCFVLAAMVSDEPGRSSKTTSNTDLWKSTRDFTASLASIHAKPYKPLVGLLKQIEGVVCDTLTYQADMRGDAILREYNRLKGTESIVATSNADSYIAEHWAFLKEAQSTRMRARGVWQEGQLALYDTELEKEFPRTWARRRSFPGRGKGGDPVSIKHYSKEGFALPLGVNSTGLDAANFGLAFLGEFCEKEDVDWEPKLIL